MQAGFWPAREVTSPTFQPRALPGVFVQSLGVETNDPTLLIRDHGPHTHLGGDLGRGHASSKTRRGDLLADLRKIVRLVRSAVGHEASGHRDIHDGRAAKANCAIFSRQGKFQLSLRPGSDDFMEHSRRLRVAHAGEMLPGGKTMRKFVIVAALAASFAVSACNTVEGAGKDMKSAGAAVEDTAKDAKN